MTKLFSTARGTQMTVRYAAENFQDTTFEPIRSEKHLDSLKFSGKAPHPHFHVGMVPFGVIFSLQVPKCHRFVTFSFNRVLQIVFEKNKN